MLSTAWSIHSKILSRQVSFKGTLVGLDKVNEPRLDGDKDNIEHDSAFDQAEVQELRHRIMMQKRSEYA